MLRMRRDFGLVVRALPRPVRRGEMQAEEERLPRPRVGIDGIDRAVAEQIGHIAMPLDRNLLLMQLKRLIAAARMVETMIEIIGGAAENPEEMVIAALERAEFRQEAEMPLADQRRRVAGGHAAARAGSDGRAAGRCFWACWR